jgi:LmbE family N-acetylglucosaminyl deacetylase
MTAAALATLIVCAAALLVGSIAGWRSAAYRRWLQYEPCQNYSTFDFGGRLETVPLSRTAQGFFWPEVANDAVSGFVDLTLNTTLFGRLTDPCLELQAGDFTDSQYFERGVRGRRFFNITRLLSSGIKPGAIVALRGRRLKWQAGRLSLHLCREGLRTDDRLLVVAPHPDDAEIGAFGLYASTPNSVVVTLTAGDDSDRFDRRPGVSVPLAREVVARLRVWDSISIPSLGGIPSSHALNLCYPDGRLGDMYADPTREFGSRTGVAVDYSALRRLNATDLLDLAMPHCSWESLVRDLSAVFSRLQPTVIVAPLPVLDPNPDHGLTTLAVCQALRSSGITDVRLFLYMVHNRSTELYPFGPAGSGVPLPPFFGPEAIGCDSFYSFPLSQECQVWKRLALQAMHDLAGLPSDELPNNRAEWRRFKTILGARLRGLSIPPTSYLRRAVRPDEIFFVLNLDQAERLARESARQFQEARS